MKRKVYEKELRKLQVELCHLQDWVKNKGARVIIVFEGRDAAGKGIGSDGRDIRWFRRCRVGSAFRASRQFDSGWKSPSASAR